MDDSEKRSHYALHFEATKSEADAMFLDLFLGGRALNLAMVADGELVPASLCFEYFYNTKHQTVASVTEDSVKEFMKSEGVDPPVAATQSQVLYRALSWHIHESHIPDRFGIRFRDRRRGNPVDCSCPLKFAYGISPPTYTARDVEVGIDPLSIAALSELPATEATRNIARLGSKGFKSLKRMSGLIVADLSSSIHQNFER